MNQQERDELRENHRRDGVLGCWTCQDYSWNDEYPCDVIRVLDVLEEVLAQVNAPIEVDLSGWEATSDPLLQPERTNGSVSPAQTDTTEYPPEGKNEECAHTDDSGLCWCERGLPRCPKCRGWFGLLHAKKAILQIKVLDASEAEVHDGSEVSSTREVCDHADWTGNAYSDGIYVDMGYRYCPKCGEKL